MAESAKRHEENANLIKEIRAFTDAAIRNQGASIKALEIQIGQMSKATVPFPSRLCDDYYDEKNGSYGLKNFDANSIGTTLLDDALPPKEKDTGSFTLPCYINNLCFNKALADLGASVSVIPFLIYTNLGLGELAPTKLIVELADRTVKHPKGIAENVLVRIDKFVFPLDFIVLECSFDPRKTILLRRNQVDDLEPTIKEGEVIDGPMMDIVKTRSDNKIIDRLDEYPIVENMDAYRDDGMGGIIVGRPFCRKACVKARRFDGMITIHKENDSVTYQMARSHPRFKHLTNAQCNNIPSLLKVSAQDELRGISHPYQKLKGFYKEVLNLGPEYINDEKVE
ncbi:glycosyl transferase, family 8 protein [Tanacetum coccineum]